MAPFFPGEGKKKELPPKLICGCGLNFSETFRERDDVALLCLRVVNGAAPGCEVFSHLGSVSHFCRLLKGKRRNDHIHAKCPDIIKIVCKNPFSSLYSH